MHKTGRDLSHPVHGAEVDSLCKVEALIKTTVVGSWECDYELSCTLIGPVNLRNKMEDYLKKIFQITLSVILKSEV